MKLEGVVKPYCHTLHVVCVTVVARLCVCVAGHCCAIVCVVRNQLLMRVCSTTECLKLYLVPLFVCFVTQCSMIVPLGVELT